MVGSFVNFGLEKRRDIPYGFRGNRKWVGWTIFKCVITTKKLRR